MSDGVYSIMESGNICIGTLEDDTCKGEILEVEVDGERPNGEKITIKDGQIVSHVIEYGGSLKYDEESGMENWVNGTKIDDGKFPETVNVGDTQSYNGYEYCYGYAWCAYCFSWSNDFEGWHVEYTGSDTEPGAILESINGEPITNMHSTFNNCAYITTAPVIPSSVTNMQETFQGCTSLTGTITVNANPTIYYDCFSGTIEDIYLTCDSTKLMELVKTGYNNVFIEGKTIFSIEGTMFMADEGMTWAQWVASDEYNPYDEMFGSKAWSADNGCVYDIIGCRTVSEVVPSDIIQNGAAYEYEPY